MAAIEEPIPSNLLKDLRCVEVGRCDGSDTQVWARNLLKTNPPEFHDLLDRQERAYQATLAKWYGMQEGAKWDGKGACPTCGRKAAAATEDIDLMELLPDEWNRVRHATAAQGQEGEPSLSGVAAAKGE